MAAIPLSPIDHIFTGVGSHPIEFVFAYGDTLDGDGLKASLEATLSHFPVMRSRLERVAEHSYAFLPAEDGLRFETRSISTSFDAVEARHVFLDSVDSAEGQPLTRIRLTQTPGGSVLGVSISHALADGFSYFYFLSSWARIHQGKDILPPSHERGRLIPERSWSASGITAEELFATCGVYWGERRETFDASDLWWDRFFFSDSDIKNLLEEAREECRGRLSFNDVIAAWLWKNSFATQSSKSEPLAYLSCPVDFRRIVEFLPRTYFGCAVALTTASLETDALVDAPIGVLAAKVREAVASVDQEYVVRGTETLETLRRQEGMSVVEECHVIRPRDGILVTNLSRLPVYDLAFDAGPPVEFDIQTAAPGGAVVLPAVGGLDVRVCRHSDPRRPSGELR